jgi:branched-chain amino acid transport system permease protein
MWMFAKVSLTNKQAAVTAIIGLVVLLCILPSFFSGYDIYLINEVLVLALFAYGWNLLFSYAGYLSFGSAAFYGLGAYTVALMYRDVSDSLWLAFPAAIIVSAVSGAVIGFFCVRLTKLYFALLTLAFATMIYSIVFRWVSFTGGDGGIPGVRRGFLDFKFFVVSLGPSMHYYYFTLVAFLLAVFIFWRIVNSPFGYTIRQIRDNSERAAFTGLNVRWYAWITFVLSSCFCGLAGALSASLRGIADPGLLFWVNSVEPVMASLLGGLFNFAGPFIGALVFVFMKSILISSMGRVWTIVFGTVLIFLVLFFPSGILGYVSEKLAKWRHE